MALNYSRSLLAAAVALTLGLTTVGCSSDSKEASDTTAAAEATTTAASGSADDTGAGDPDDQQSTSEATDPDAETECESDSNNLSGSSTVLFAADVTTGQTEADITPELTMTVADGAADPETLTVPVDTMFGVALPEGAGITGIVIGCAGSQTAVPGGTIGFLITAPGTYVVTDELAGTDVGTIVVE